MTCEVRGCKATATWNAAKLFGDRATLHVCDEHKPDAAKRPASLRNLPFFYEVTAIENRSVSG